MMSLQKAAWMASHPIAAIRELRTVARLARSVPEFGPEPWMDKQDIETLTALVDPQHAVVEYGSGSSSLYFASRSLAVHSVDSSRSYIAAVMAEAGRRGLANVNVAPVDLGPVENWGMPIDHYPTARNIAKWRRYLQAPWDSVGTDPVSLVIVDGRFRAACAAYALARLHERGQTGATVFFDDFVGREETYGRIAEIAEIKRTPGRGAFVSLRDGAGSGEADAFAERAITDLS